MDSQSLPLYETCNWYLMEIDWLLASVQVLCPGCLIKLSQQPHEGDYKAPLLYCLNTVILN